jgi:hypothetical protein
MAWNARYDSIFGLANPPATSSQVGFNKNIEMIAVAKPIPPK